MAHSKAAASRHAFVVRIWREAGSPNWRGSVQQVSSGQAASFDSLDKLLVFLEQQIAGLADQDGPGLK
ncbi:MAG: hypothetical protein JXA93_20260 [Anaerolineae bacterium]|nr:hypothetical protein [Anaerolineae bacterium]